MKILQTMKIIALTIVIALASCGNRNNETISKQKENEVSKKTEEIKDTLRDPNHFHYYADVSLKLFAKWILNDSLKPGFNAYTMKAMDSLNAQNFEDRKFYFKVFLKIKEKADGALAEGVGGPAYKYVENHTKEFLELSETITKEQFESWGYTVGVEILLSSNVNSPEKDAQDYIEKIKNNCTECSNEQKTKLETFCNSLLKGISDNK